MCLTRKNDLRRILEEIKPDQLLLELPEEAGARVEAARHSDEMAFADRWARTKGVSTGYFDVDMSILRDGISEEDPEYMELVNREVAELQAYSWQELNRKEPWQMGKLASTQREFWRRFFDEEKWDRREKGMLENIRRLRKSNGTVLILTGAGHLDFFQRELPDAEFRLRD